MTCDDYIDIVDYRVHTQREGREYVQGGKENDVIGEKPQLE